MIIVESSGYFEVISGPELNNSAKLRWLCLRDFFKKCLQLPLLLLGKSLKTFFRSAGFVLAIALVVLTFGTSLGLRAYLEKRAMFLVKDLIDWFLLPFAIFVRMSRFLLGVSLHPKYYFNSYP